MVKSLIHKAGEAGEREFGVQRCLRCDVILVDNREVENGRFFGYGTYIAFDEGAFVPSSGEPNCKPREQILADMRRMRDELRLDKHTLDHWNRAVRKSDEELIPHDPQLLVMLAQYDQILADEADRNIGPARRREQQAEGVH